MFIAKKQTHHCNKHVVMSPRFLVSFDPLVKILNCSFGLFFFVGRCGEHGGKKKRQQNNDFAVIFFFF